MGAHVVPRGRQRRSAQQRQAGRQNTYLSQLRSKGLHPAMGSRKPLPLRSIHPPRACLSSGACCQHTSAAHRRTHAHTRTGNVPILLPDRPRIKNLNRSFAYRIICEVPGSAVQSSLHSPSPCAACTRACTPAPRPTCKGVSLSASRAASPTTLMTAACQPVTVSGTGLTGNLPGSKAVRRPTTDSP